MQCYITPTQTQKLLRVYLLKTCYDLTKSLQKDLSSTLASSCLIIRRTRIKNETEFGYKESLKTGFIKKIHFVYLSTLEDLIVFLWAQVQAEKAMTAGVFVDGIGQYFGDRFSFEENGRGIAICLNLLHILSEKQVTKKQKIKVGFSFYYNSYVFHRAQFMNYMQNSGIVCWQITGKDILKNGHEFENEWTKAFMQQYGGSANLKHQNDL